MEFLRLGSQIAGTNHGCCAVDVIQGFDVDPEGLSSIQVTNGDINTPCVRNGEFVFLGPTNLDIFKQRLRIGTFWTGELRSHAFLAVLTGNQLQYGGNPKKWLAILKDHGFEFIRAFQNSVYSSYRPPVYLFGLFRNFDDIDPSKPPKEWTALPECTLTQQEIWDRDSLRLLTETELRAAGAPVILTGGKGQPPMLKPAEPVKTEPKVETTEIE